VLDLQSVECQADPGEIGQVVVNLLMNAIRALARGGPPRQLWLSAQSREGLAVVRIADSGPGVPAEIAPRIFEPFFTTEEVGQGTGLGLSISRQIAQQHGGTLEFVGGSCFELRLPR
jgi:signal transduction histidine kinase